jgi:putative ABC transport system permease protein
MMSPGAAVTVALTALRVNALRSFLAMLGVIIGVGAVIVMISVSQGARAAVEEQISALGANTLNVRPGSRNMGGRRGGAGSAQMLSDEDATALRDEVPYITAAAGFLQVRGLTAVVDGMNWNSEVMGSHPDLFAIRGWRPAEGRFYDLTEFDGAARVAVIGRTVSRELFPAGGAVGATMRINGVPLEIIGVLEERGQSSWGQDQDDIIIMPTTTMRGRVSGVNWPGVRDPVTTITLQVDAPRNMEAATAEVEEVLRIRRGISPGAEDNFSVVNFAEFLRARSETEQQLGLLLGITAAISLLVGGIGIMNIMLVSVTERTREIGLRLAIGARQGDVRNQFLVEAVVLCLTGGLMGLGLGIGAAYWVQSLEIFQVSVEPMIALVAIGAAAGVGIVFGFYPAHQASRLNPIDALRYE